jgi:hypothetical protein
VRSQCEVALIKAGCDLFVCFPCFGICAAIKFTSNAQRASGIYCRIHILRMARRRVRMRNRERTVGADEAVSSGDRRKNDELKRTRRVHNFWATFTEKSVRSQWKFTLLLTFRRPALTLATARLGDNLFLPFLSPLLLPLARPPALSQIVTLSFGNSANSAFDAPSGPGFLPLLSLLFLPFARPLLGPIVSIDRSSRRPCRLAVWQPRSSTIPPAPAPVLAVVHCTLSETASNSWPPGPPTVTGLDLWPHRTRPGRAGLGRAEPRSVPPVMPLGASLPEGSEGLRSGLQDVSAADAFCSTTRTRSFVYAGWLSARCQLRSASNHSVRARVTRGKPISISNHFAAPLLPGNSA